jgi:transcriptional regulator with XRE-family HTH domain
VPRTRKHYLTPVDEKTIGRHVREIRTRRGFTQAELAEKLGTKQSLISLYEQGQVRLHGALIAGLASALRVSADELLGLKTLPANGSPPDRRFLRRVEKIERLPKREKQLLLGTIDAVLKSSGVA